jgi:hypothetical protein
LEVLQPQGEAGRVCEASIVAVEWGPKGNTGPRLQVFSFRDAVWEGCLGIVWGS